MHGVEPDLTVDDPGVAVAELGLPLPQRLHLAAGQHQSGLVGLEDVVVVAGPAILGHRPAVGALLGRFRGGRHGPITVVRHGSVAAVLRVEKRILDTMVASALDGYPLEACGLLGGFARRAGHGHGRRRAIRSPTWPPRPGCTRSSRGGCCAPTGPPKPAGGQLIGVYHSHTHTEGKPSPTDVAQAPDPDWHYVLVSLRDTHPSVRSWRIRDGKITEEPVVLQW